MTSDEIAQRLNAKPTGPGKWTAKCPGHDDANASLSITEGKDGRILLKCFAGCEFKVIVSAMGLKQTDFFPPREAQAKTRMVQAYDYTNASGKLLFQVCRFEPKAFRQRRPDGNGRWIWNMTGVNRVLYRLPQVIEAVKAEQDIYTPEGEKDCDVLVAIGLCATCNPGGAGKWRTPVLAVRLSSHPP